MDDQLMEFVRDRFDSVDAKLDENSEAFKEHVSKDEAYWKLIDGQQAQLSMVKWLGSGVSGSAFIAWLWSKFGH